MTSSSSGSDGRDASGNIYNNREDADNHRSQDRRYRACAEPQDKDWNNGYFRDGRNPYKQRIGRIVAKF